MSLNTSSTDEDDLLDDSVLDVSDWLGCLAVATLVLSLFFRPNSLESSSGLVVSPKLVENGKKDVAVECVFSFLLLLFLLLLVVIEFDVGFGVTNGENENDKDDDEDNDLDRVLFPLSSSSSPAPCR